MTLTGCFIVERTPTGYEEMRNSNELVCYTGLWQRWIGGVDENGNEVDLYIVEDKDEKAFGINRLVVDGEEQPEYTDESIIVTVEKRKYLKYTLYNVPPIEMFFE